MKSIRRQDHHLVFLISIFLGALCIRAVGLRWGIPSQNNPYSAFWADEPGILFAVLSLGKGDYLIEILQNYPLFYYFSFVFFGGYYIIGRIADLFSSLGDFQAQYLLDMSQYLLIGRYFTLVAASLTVPVTHLVGRKLFGGRVGALASVFLLFSFGHVVYSKVFRLDTALPLIFLTSFYLLVNLLDTPPGRLRPYVLCALGLTLVTGTKVTGWSFLLPLALVPSLTAGYFLKQPFRLPKLDRRFIFLLFVFLLTYIAVIAPFLPQLIATIQKSVASQWIERSYQNAGAMSPYTHSFFWHVSYVLPRQMGVTVYPFVWLGLFLLPFEQEKRKKVLLLIALLLGYMVPIGFSVRTSWRDMLPMLPFLSIVAAYGFNWITAAFFNWIDPVSKRRQGIILSAVLTGLLLVPIHNIYRQKVLILQMDTRDIARDWIEANLPATSKLAIESYGPGVLNITRETATRSYINSQGWPNKPLPSTQMFEVIWLDNALNAGKSDMEPDLLLPYLIESKIDYVVVSSGYYGRYYNNGFENHYPELTQQARTFHDLIESNLILMQQFIPDHQNRPGPIIKIYAVPSDLRLSDAQLIVNSFIPFPHLLPPASVVGYYQFSPR